MEGLVRALKCATWRAGRVIGLTILMSVGFIFYFMLLSRTPFTVQNIVTRFPQMLLFVGSFMYLSFGVVDVVTYVQYAMSCGCTRKNVLLSAVYMNMLEIAGVELALFVYLLLAPKEWVLPGGSTLCGLALLAGLFSTGFSLMMGIFVKRFGKVAYVFVVLVCAVIGGIMGGVAAMNEWDILIVGTPNLPVVVTLAFIGWYVLAAAVFWLCIRKMEVRV